MTIPWKVMKMTDEELANAIHKARASEAYKQVKKELLNLKVQEAFIIPAGEVQLVNLRIWVSRHNGANKDKRFKVVVKDDEYWVCRLA